MPAVDEAGDEESDEEEAREQDPEHQTEVALHTLLRGNQRVRRFPNNVSDPFSYDQEKN